MIDASTAHSEFLTSFCGLCQWSLGYNIWCRSRGSAASDGTSLFSHSQMPGCHILALLLVRFSAGTVANPSGTLYGPTKAALHVMYNVRSQQNVRFALERTFQPVATIFVEKARLYNFALLRGRRITPTSRSLRHSAGSSIFSALWDGKAYAGEVISSLNHYQPGIGDSALPEEFRWMQYSPLTPVLDDPWSGQ